MIIVVLVHQMIATAEVPGCTPPTHKRRRMCLLLMFAEVVNS